MKKIMIVGLMVLVVTLTGCGEQAGQEATPVIMPDIFSSVVSASGEVVPARRAILSGEVGGQAVTISVEEGDTVEAGQVLIQLDATDLEAAVSQAEAALAVAQARLAQVKAGARPEEITSAEGAVTAAQAQLAAAEGNLAAAQAELERLQAGARPEEVVIAEIGVARASTARDMAERIYELIANRPGAEVSQEAFNSKLAAHDLHLAQAQLDLVKAGATAQELALAQANVRSAEGQVRAARAAVAQAQAQFDLLNAGASEEEIAVSEAQVFQAQAALNAAKVASSKATLTAPFAGTIGAVYVHEGEIVNPGQPLIALGDLSTLRVETTDLNEVDVARVTVRQKADLTFDALPERKLVGTVVRIAPMATVGGGGGTNYTVIIEFDEKDPALLWGMTAFVDIEVGR